MKYYVFSGPMKVMIQAESAREAALKTIKHFGKGKLLDYYTYVSEKGYRKDITFITHILLKEANGPPDG